MISSDWLPFNTVITTYRISPRDLKTLLSEKSIKSKGVYFDEHCPDETIITLHTIGQRKWNKLQLVPTHDGFFLHDTRYVPFGYGTDKYPIWHGYTDIQISKADLKKYLSEPKVKTPRSNQAHTLFLQSVLNKISLNKPKVSFDDFIKAIHHEFLNSRCNAEHPLYEFYGCIEDKRVILEFSNRRMTYKAVEKFFTRHKPTKQTFN